MVKSDSRQMIAILIIMPSFLVIGGLIASHYWTLNIYNSQINSDTTNTEILDAIEKANQRIYNILVPALAAWVGGVVAYYFGSKNSEKAMQGQMEIIRTMKQGSTGSLSAYTVGELIDSNPELKNFPSVTINEIIDKTFETKIEEKGFVAVLFEFPSWQNHNLKTDDGNTDEQKLKEFYAEYSSVPLGILYEGDLYAVEDYDGKCKDKILGEVLIDAKIVDTITNKEWGINPTQRMDNFAEVLVTDTLAEAKAKLGDVGSNPDNARAFVLNKQKDVVGLISNKSILSKME